MTILADLDPALYRALELHETKVHARAGRVLRDLGDAYLLHDASDREPFWNRIAGLRLPDDPGAFDHRLTELMALFHGLDRIPHIWPPVLHPEPADVVERLVAAGFEDAGKGLVMILADPSALDAGARPTPHPRVTLERMTAVPRGEARERVASEIASILIDAFDVDPGRRAGVIAETAALFDHTDQHIVLARIDGEPAAVARRTTFDRMSYLSAIGTKAAYRGHGLGKLVTATVIEDALAAQSRVVYLGVWNENEPAIALYGNLGFVRLGSPAPDLLLRR